MAGYNVDPEALEGAIKELEDIQDDLVSLLRQVDDVKPGELTANDDVTNKARQIIQDRATGEQGSLRTSTNELIEKLRDKIASYKETLAEYKRADDAAAADVDRL
ncbi:hypothetical protein IQ251_18855 [Saccharopolyspora sp. HNM0983]|uniref:Uncharacterized protein n=1 Tax=Saccharopolyspora montiporae TaxID=2781240 RepID=A0A929BD17_9PSEU|nr:hypothetical protein [Saccharopolyspora sp. HNM0983]MBE9376515.1 hypothetical protein [Saccharopolyspora sp. HNM0983]